jgi:hypothetical protein
MKNFLHHSECFSSKRRETVVHCCVAVCFDMVRLQHLSTSILEFFSFKIKRRGGGVAKFLPCENNKTCLSRDISMGRFKNGFFLFSFCTLSIKSVSLVSLFFHSCIVSFSIFDIQLKRPSPVRTTTLHLTVVVLSIIPQDKVNSKKGEKKRGQKTNNHHHHHQYQLFRITQEEEVVGEEGRLGSARGFLLSCCRESFQTYSDFSIANHE